MLRTVRKASPDGRLTMVSASDPLNLVGVLTPGARVPALPDNRVAFRDGAPVASLQGGELHWYAEVEEETRSKVIDLVGPRRSRKTVPERAPVHAS